MKMRSPLQNISNEKLRGFRRKYKPCSADN
jgi:hypothetical protein